MIDSPYHPYSDARFTINEKGTDDIEEERKRRGSTRKSSIATIRDEKEEQ
jgi:DNA repair protein RadA